MPAGKTVAYRCDTCGAVFFHPYGTELEPRLCGAVRLEIGTPELLTVLRTGQATGDGTSLNLEGLITSLASYMGRIFAGANSAALVACLGTVAYDHYAGDLDFSK
jgi:hypothetical protein